MKLIVFGDLHGENGWKKHRDKIDSCNYMIFMGDYMDSFTHTDVNLIHNLDDLINFKCLYPNKVILLLGNHDNQYFLPDDVSNVVCSGFRHHILTKVKPRFRNNLDLFQPAHQVEDILFTHGGLLHEHLKYLNSFFDKKDMRYDTYLNSFFKTKINPMLNISPFRGGSDKHSGIFWTDWAELMMEKNPLPINQIVGHTASYGDKFHNRKGNFIFNADSILSKKIFYKIFKNANNNWIIEKMDL